MHISHMAECIDHLQGPLGAHEGTRWLICLPMTRTEFPLCRSYRSPIARGTYSRSKKEHSPWRLLVGTAQTQNIEADIRRQLPNRLPLRKTYQLNLEKAGLFSGKVSSTAALRRRNRRKGKNEQRIDGQRGRGGRLPPLARAEPGLTPRPAAPLRCRVPSSPTSSSAVRHTCWSSCQRSV